MRRSVLAVLCGLALALSVPVVSAAPHHVIASGIGSALSTTVPAQGVQ